MSLEGLQAILDKKEVVPTVSADDLKSRAAQVEAGYLYHVRTYLPINRAADGGEGQLSVQEFEKRLIKQVKEGKVPRGYITAGYGYGKTTTALYLWQRAQESNLVIVPPFTMSQLPDLLDGVYGWLRHKLAGSRPALIDELDQVYGATINRSLEQIANERNLTLEQVQSLWQDGYLLIELQAAHYIKFFESATRIALDAGYDGLVVMPDEIQQYFRVKKEEGGDPIAPFFNIIQLLNTRASAASDWRFGFIMVITLEELAMIRDTYRRTDLLHRMKDLQIDLTALYDQNFAPNLWELMAQRFDFVREKDLITDRETLLALGEITARKDISDGPRTAINVFRRMVSRFAENNGRVKPYTPIDLITDFLDEQTIAFAGNDKIRNVVRRALSDDRVRQDFERYAPAIKLAAAFPTNGVPLKVQQRYGHDRPLAELMQKAIGDIVRSGSLEQGAITLIGLAQEKERTNWLPTTVREFRLGYNELARITQERAEDAFIALLRERVFVSGKWKLIGEWQRSYIANRSLIFDGAFDAFKTEFPRRRVHVRLLWEEEPVKDAEVQGDVCIEYRLSLYRSLAQEERRDYADPAESRGDSTARIHLNLMYSDINIVSPGIQKELEDVWSPYDLSPLVLLNIYQLVTEKFEQRQVPKREEGKIRDGFLPEVLDTLIRTLFNEKVGGELEAAGATITEVAIGIMLKARYANYVPLVAVQNWKNSIDKYDNALRLLELPQMRQGQIDVEGVKEEIAKRLGGSVTAFDSFQKTFPTLLQTVKEFKGNTPGVVRFTLHPLETEIMNWLRGSDKKDVVVRSGQRVELRRLNVASVVRQSNELGYLEEEVEALILLLQTRGLAEVKHDWLFEVYAEALSTEEVRQQLRDLERDLTLLADGFESSQLNEWRQQVENSLRPRLNELVRDKAANPNDVAKLSRTLQTRHNDVLRFAQDQQNTLLERINGFQKVRAFPSHSLENLGKIFKIEVEYADQVNALMAALRRDGERIQREVNSRRTILTEAGEILGRSTLGYDELARQARSMKTYAKAAEEVNHLVEEFNARYQQFSGWRDLVNQGIVLARDLANEDPAETSEVGADFSKLSIDIRAEISSKASRLEALPLHEAFMERLNELRTALEAVKKQKRGEFIQYQNNYQRLLSKARLLQGNTWREVTYNPLDPRGSYEQVNQQVQEVVFAVVKQITGLTTSGRQTLDTLRKTAQKLAPHKRDEVIAEVEQLVPVYGNIIDKIRELDEAAHEPVLLRDLEHSFPALVEQIAQAGVVCAEQNASVARLKQIVGASEPTKLEAQLLERLRSQQSNQHEIDIVDLKAVFVSGEDVFWTVLQGLYDKDYIRLNIRLKEE